MGRLNEIMESHGYNTRERWNFYASMAIMPLTVTSIAYFGLLRGNPIEDPWYFTFGKGAIALATNIPLAPIELGVGTGLAISSLIHLRTDKSKKKQKGLEQEIQD